MLLLTVQVDSAASAAEDDDCTVYVDATPSAVNETSTAPLPAYATTGFASGVVPGAMAFEANDVVAVLVPPLGVTENVY